MSATVKTAKTVRFSDDANAFSQSRIKHKSAKERVINVVAIREIIVDFLNTTVAQVLVAHGEHMPNRLSKQKIGTNDTDTGRMIRKLTDTMSSVLSWSHVTHYMKWKFGAELDQWTGDFDRLRTAVTDFIRFNMHKTMADVMRMALSGRGPVATYASIILISIGLHSFLTFNQCSNSCYRYAHYDEEAAEYKIYLRKNAKREHELVDECLGTHQTIEKLIDHDDIRDFDNLLLLASGHRCSLIRKTSANERA